MIIAVTSSLAFAVVATLTVFSSAESPGPALTTGWRIVGQLAGNGGGTEAFAVGASFAGFLVFVTFIAVLAAEFSAARSAPCCCEIRTGYGCSSASWSDCC